MAEIDQDVALKYKPLDITPGLNAIGNYTQSMAQANLANTEARFRQKKLEALGMMGDELDRGVPPEKAVRHMMRVDPETGLKFLEGNNLGTDTTNRRNFGQSGNVQDLKSSPQLMPPAAGGLETHQKTGREYLTGQAYGIMDEPDATRRGVMWRQMMDTGHAKGWIPDGAYKNYRTLNPNDPAQWDQMQQLIKTYTGPEKFEDMSGSTAGRQAAARAGVEPRAVNPDESLVVPGRMPGAPTANAPIPQPGTIVSGPKPKMVTPQVPVSEKEKDAQEGKLPYYKEVPTVNLNAAAPQEGQPGVVRSGASGQVREAEKGAAKQLEDINEAATNASKTKSSIGTMRSAIDSGKIKTGKLSDIRYTVAGYIAGATGDRKAAAIAAGLDPSNAEIFEKESTRMGLTFARQTEGAREAVAAINIALKANPSLLNTEAGNKMILNIMDKGADWDIERGKAANSYFRKQLNDTKHGHLFGFDPWFNANHAPAHFTSEAYPHQLPADPRDVDPKITYTFKNKDGVPVKGKFDPEKKTWGVTVVPKDEQ